MLNAKKPGKAVVVATSEWEIALSITFLDHHVPYLNISWPVPWASRALLGHSRTVKGLLYWIIIK